MYTVYRCRERNLICFEFCSGEWFNGKTAAFKVADLGSNPCSPPNGINLMHQYRYTLLPNLVINLFTGEGQSGRFFNFRNNVNPRYKFI